MPILKYTIFHGGSFSTCETTTEVTYDGGIGVSFTMDPDYMSYFDLKSQVESEFKYNNVNNIYYLASDGKLMSITTNAQVMEFNKQALEKGEGVLYVHHNIDGPQVISMSSEAMTLYNKKVVDVDDESGSEDGTETGMGSGDDCAEYECDKDDLEVSDDELVTARIDIMEDRGKSIGDVSVQSFSEVVGAANETINTNLPNDEERPSVLKDHENQGKSPGVEDIVLPESVTHDMEADLTDDPVSDSSSDEEDLQREKRFKYPKFNTKTDLSNVKFVVGLEFQNAEDFKIALREYAIQQRKDIYMHKNEKHYVIGKCRSAKGCPWRIRCSKVQGCYELL